MKHKKKLRPCQYCGESETVKGQQIRLTPVPCICGEIHSVCRECQMDLNRTLGEFPNYKVVLKKCPPTK